MVKNIKRCGTSYPYQIPVPQRFMNHMIEIETML
jgi:hypothetical protein